VGRAWRRRELPCRGATSLEALVPGGLAPRSGAPNKGDPGSYLIPGTAWPAGLRSVCSWPWRAAKQWRSRCGRTCWSTPSGWRSPRAPCASDAPATPRADLSFPANRQPWLLHRLRVCSCASATPRIALFHLHWWLCKSRHAACRLLDPRPTRPAPGGAQVGQRHVESKS